MNLQKANLILGMNARNQIYLRANLNKGRRIADSKLLTKKALAKAGLPTPHLLGVIKTPREVLNFDWFSLPDNFVLKPVTGYGGEGIVIVKKKGKWAGEWHLMDDSVIDLSDLRLRTIDILGGQYSLHNLPDLAMIEERIKVAKIFRKYAFHGTPDIRVVVFNRVPVAAMLRLPTPESRGKANLHQGAIGVGIDLATGITTYGIKTFGTSSCQNIRNIPWTKKKINGLKLPNWNYILTLAVRCQDTVPSLGFLGVDIVFDKKHGPVILEFNTRPGLWIQSANNAPLKKRLERVEGLEIKDAEQGVRVARTLFAERFADRVMAEEGVKILETFEQVKIRGADKSKVPVLAKIDTGAWRTSIDKKLARKLGLLKRENILWRKKIRSSVGVTSRPVINLTYYIAGRRIKTIAGVSNRQHLRYPLLIGRKDLTGFLVKPRK